MKGLFLDDERNPEDVTWVNYRKDIDWVVVRTHKDFIEAVKKESFEVYSFDHDLQDYVDGVEYTGYSCVKHLTNVYMGVLDAIEPLMYFHTQNPIGKDNMAYYWENFADIYYD